MSSPSSQLVVHEVPSKVMSSPASQLVAHEVPSEVMSSRAFQLKMHEVPFEVINLPDGQAAVKMRTVPSDCAAIATVVAEFCDVIATPALFCFKLEVCLVAVLKLLKVLFLDRLASLAK